MERAGFGSPAGSGLHEFDQHAACAAGMQERHLVTLRAEARSGIDEVEAQGGQAVQFAVDVRDPIRHVVQASISFGYEAGKGAVRVGSFDEFDLPDEGDLYSLGRNELDGGTRVSSEVFVGRLCFDDRGDGDSDMIER